MSDGPIIFETQRSAIITILTVVPGATSAERSTAAHWSDRRQIFQALKTFLR